MYIFDFRSRRKLEFKTEVRNPEHDRFTFFSIQTFT